MEMKFKIGLLGPLGTFTEEAAIKYCEDLDITLEKIPYRTISEVFREVQNGKVLKGVVPIENFFNGHVIETMDNLYKSELKIQRALALPIHHCLAVTKSSNNIEVIKSHPQALAQCSDYLQKNYPNVDLVDTSSTAMAMKDIAEGKLENTAAIGSEISAERYGLEILDKEIGNKVNNQTMFIVIGKGDSERSERNKTSIVITPPVDRPGILSEILNEFAVEKIDLKFIQSRPDGKGKYLFYLDFEGYEGDENVKRALQKIESNLGGVNVIKILGSYPYVSFS